MLLLQCRVELSVFFNCGLLREQVRVCPAQRW